MCLNPNIEDVDNLKANLYTLQADDLEKKARNKDTDQIM